MPTYLYILTYNVPTCNVPTYLRTYILTYNVPTYNVPTYLVERFNGIKGDKKQELFGEK